MSLTDHAEPCHQCTDGYSHSYEPDGYTGEMRWVSYPCYYCQGTGRQTVLVFPAKPTNQEGTKL